jgi:hypothetical protein
MYLIGAYTISRTPENNQGPSITNETRFHQYNLVNLLGVSVMTGQTALHVIPNAAVSRATP